MPKFKMDVKSYDLMNLYLLAHRYERDASGQVSSDILDSFKNAKQASNYEELLNLLDDHIECSDGTSIKDLN